MRKEYEGKDPGPRLKPVFVRMNATLVAINIYVFFIEIKGFVRGNWVIYESEYQSEEEEAETRLMSVFVRK